MTVALPDLSEEVLAELSEEERQVYARAKAREQLLAGPAEFAAAMGADVWTPYPFLVVISDEIVGMIEHDTCDVLIVEAPVRHGKSELCSRWTPAWFLTKYPDQWVGLASYEAEFAATHSAAARELFTQYGGLFGAFPHPRVKASKRWLTTAGGGMWSAGAGGAITGKGFSLGIIDDPLKNDEEADSELRRERIWEWWRATFSTRRNKGTKSKVLIVMSRWHMDDLVGRLKADHGMLRVRTVHMPAIAVENPDQPDPLGRAPGEALCPERFPVEQLDSLRSTVGPRWWSALYQQRPQPAGGGKFKRDHFRYWQSATRSDGRYFDLRDPDGVDPVAVDTCGRFQIMDVAATRTKASDWTVLTTWAVTPSTERTPSRLLLVDMKRVRVEGGEHLPLVRQAFSEHRPVWVGIERSPVSLTLIDNARLAGVPVRQLRPESNKVMRADTASALFEQGRIYLPLDAPWLHEVESELLEFPTGKHDDIVDTVSYAARELALLHAPSGHVPKPPPDTSLDARIREHAKQRAKGPKFHPILGAW